jgi:hypothetical protein
MNTPQVKFKVEDLTASVGTPIEGVSFVLGKAIRGKINNPDTIFNSYPAFIKEHGGIADGNSAAMVKRLFEGGGSMRFCNLSHYSDIDDAETLTAVKATIDSAFTDEDLVEIFSFEPKNAGVSYNNLQVVLAPSTNGLATHFNLIIEIIGDSNTRETYANLSIPLGPEGSTADATKGYLSAIEKSSRLVKPVYLDFITGGIPNTPDTFVTPEAGTKTFAGGTDGGALVSTDLIGSSVSATGLNAFDEYEEALQIFYLLDPVADTVHIAADAYVTGRDDMQYWLFLPADAQTKDAMVIARTALGINNKLTNIFASYIKVSDPSSGAIVEQQALADIAGLAANSDKNFGTHFSFSGNKRGVLRNVLGVVLNFGTNGRRNDLNELANRQINVIINRDSQIKLWNSYTSLIGQSQEQFIGVVRGTLSIKKALRPLLEDYLEEPNDMKAWKLMYYQVKPYLDQLVEKRALFSYRWEGDQDATSLDNLIINDPDEVSQGKYKVRLFLSFIVSMVEIEVTLVLTSGNITFETNA